MKVGLIESDVPVTNLAVGVPDIPPPGAISELVTAAAVQNRYSYVPSKGTGKALGNLKQLLFADEPTVREQENLMLVNGAKYGIYLALKTICNHNDTVLLMQPYWLSYPEIVNSLGLQYVTWSPEVDDDGSLEFDFGQLELLLSQQKIRVLILNNPNNPSGKIFSRSWIEQLNTLLVKYDAWLLIDEVYRNLVYDTTQSDCFKITDGNVIRVGSLSKSLAIPGLRIGYIYGPADFITYADVFNQHIQTCLNSVSCYVMEKIEPALLQDFSRYCSDIYEERFRTIKRVFADSSLQLLNSSASFYSLVDFRAWFENGEKACEFLYNELKIIAVPGSPYGQDFSSYIRICLTLPQNELSEKLQLIKLNLPHAHI